MKKVIVTLEDGTETVCTVDGMFIEGMHFDGMDEILGIKETRRASDVEFLADIQMWRATIRPEFRHSGTTVLTSATFVKRSDAISWERRYLNEGK
jgi:hypothetical protein